MFDKAINTYNSVADLLLPEITHMVDFCCCGENGLSSAIYKTNSTYTDIEIVSLPELTIDRLPKEQTCIVFNGTIHTLKDNLTTGVSEILSVMSSFEFRQIIFIGYAADDSMFTEPIDTSNERYSEFYELLSSSEAMLDRYSQSLFADAFISDGVVVADLVQFILRDNSGLPWEQAVQTNCVFSPANEIYRVFGNLSTYSAKHLKYQNTEMYSELFSNLGVSLDYPLQYKISLIKNNL